ncbi:MAG: alpha/beta fold hydrolase [Nitriliruptoraceae bacterium]
MSGRLGRRVVRGAGWGVAGLAGQLVVAVATTAVLDALHRRRVLPPGELVELADDRRLSATSVADDLHDALQRRGLAGPYVLVGHSLGGGYVRVFAARYPDEVAGLVLLDPVHEDQLARQPTEATEQLEQAQQQLAVAPLLARLGAFRLLDVQRDTVASLPEDAGEQHRARSVTAAGMHAYGREVGVLPDLLVEVADAEEAAGRTAFGGVPTVIISATEPGEGETPEAREAMNAMHRDLAGRSPTARHLTISGADHLRLVTDPDHAREVAAPVLDLLAELDAPQRDP